MATVRWRCSWSKYRSDGGYRATAKLRDGAVIPDQAPLPALVDAQGRGRFVVTLDPRDSAPARPAWQGIVPFESETVAGALERYMQRSEQIPTRLWLAADGGTAPSGCCCNGCRTKAASPRRPTPTQAGTACSDWPTP